MYSPVSFRGPGYFSQPSTSASSDTGTRAALDELLLALADAVAEADCEADGELDAEAEALAEGVGEPTLAFASSLSWANIGGATGHEGNRATEQQGTAAHKAGSGGTGARRG